MKLIELRNELKKTYRQHGKDVADIDFIVSELLKVSRTELSLIDKISSAQEKKIRQYAKFRLDKSIPIDKLFKKSYFYGLQFFVDENVLSPRQDSETLVDSAIKYIKLMDLKNVLDLCTGSGCLAIAIEKNCMVNLTASDISKSALKIAKLNAKRLSANIRFVLSDLFENIDEKFDLIISNPPYIPSDVIGSLDREVKDYDPMLALDGGADGLDFYKKIASELSTHLTKRGILILEIGYNQCEDVISIFKDYKFLEKVPDLNGIDRVLVFQNKE